MVKAILFDFDGTLANTLGMYIKAYRQTLIHYGFNFTDEDIVSKCFAKKEEDICEALGIPEKAEAFRKLYFSSKHDMLSENKLFPETLELLTELQRRGIKLAIATFTRRWYIDKMVDQLGIRRFFDDILSFDDVKNPKPHPEMILKLCKTLEVQPSEVLMIGDSKGDILMGKSAGVKTALFIPEENKKFYNFEELEKATNPDSVIKTISEVASLSY